MKLEKITEAAPALEKRWYDDACGAAMGMELVGERWALLVVRELMFGPRRFSELRAGLPGISANILTQRLEGLERVGVLRRRQLPPPASAQVYELTPWGYEADVILQELGRWAARSPLHDPTLPLSASSVVMSFRTMFDPARARGERARLGLRFGPDAFLVEVGPDGVHARRTEPQDAQAEIATDPVTLASVVYDARPLAEAETAGALAVSGDRALVERFAGWFTLPAKVEPD